MIEVYLFDNAPAGPGRRHGPRGPCHAGTATVGFEYQVEELVLVAQVDHAKIVRIECPALGRTWERADGSGLFVESNKVASHPLSGAIVRVAAGGTLTLCADSEDEIVRDG